MNPQASADDAPVVIGLVLSVEPDCPADLVLQRQLRACPELAIGDRQGAWIPCTATTRDPRVLHAWLESLPGIRAVDVVFTEVATPSDAAARAHRRHAPDDDHFATLPKPAISP